ncbi:hypothetical protein [Pseudonocardia alni]|uniref:Uncharacterized protein n=1 Tax=Pseudonocardia alni TaxID=33907 RepID=A0A852VW82_PSEA5|nr:hypothetical protein [Pseudonocardia antarctica]NYG00349.1 hypothetical protein [Pseudonocardia antarctica]
MTGGEQVREYRSAGHRYRLRSGADGSVTVERLAPDGWHLLDDDAAAAVVDRLHRGDPGTGQ